MPIEKVGMWNRGRGHEKVGVLVIEIKGMKWGESNRESRDVAQGEGTLKGECFSDRIKRDEVGQCQ